MLCLSFEISKCFVIYIPLLNTQPKKNTTTRIRRDHQYGKIHALFPRKSERREKKNIRLNFEIGFAVDRKSSILTGKAQGEI